jgi:hypothetical protein
VNVSNPLVHAAQVREEREILTPAHAKLHDDAMHLDDLGVDPLHEGNPTKRLPCAVEPEIFEEFSVGY